ncbi:Uma2 family endonuclease [Salinibacter ruber]|jgi:Uma2 family endonuclease|uniref:Uma2 family endonuclease n=1 Tax=Salinibacter ruber TaxID=146919 RepID=A0A9X2U228_9BACT|nr:Uma2 family endonuclease [Salinibacter ruber]MBB4091125.1 Uma2 family endonuclease [Salinibacter ruber]MCS3683859.1 Uma2 family endonuclease [Salinibacter ruber]MCS3857865.1 Uma2 family endonuclease [Salinibacter ruber]MCS3864692.1 Uma2 family endonuclease [Salinibacter ruber]MCS4054659.1 Uma2 family endonuclease [Salinibacter ruber]
MPSSSAPPVPALQNGDRLTRDEFERRYEAMPNVKKAELIEGTVYMPSPVHASGHGEPHAHLMTWLGTYAAATPGVRVADNATIRLDLDNEPQPDGLLRIDEDAGGQSRISDDDYVEGPPELIVEIAHSSAAYDLHDKKRAYRRNGVQEYLVWQIEEAQVDWFASEGGAYLSLSPDEDGQIESRTFPGLVLDVDALLSDNFDTVLAALQEQTGTERHQAFVEQLAHQDDED